MIAAAGIPGGFQAYDYLENIDGSSMVRRMIYSFRRSGVEDIVAITGYRAEETEKRLAKLGAIFLRSPDYESEQMLDYAVRGLSYLSKTCDRIFFCPADVPLFTEDTLLCMIKADAPVVIPVYEGRKGHPVLLDSTLTEKIGTYSGERGLKGAIDASKAPVCLLPVDDSGVIVRAHYEQDFEELAQKEHPPAIHPRVKLQLVKDTPFFGPGIMVLLRQVDALGSVREACEKTGMSYSKGWSLIKTAEAQLGYRVVERSPGGRTGGMAGLSEKGRLLMGRYEQLERAVSDIVEEKYREIFAESGDGMPGGV